MSWADLKKGRYSQDHGEYFITFNCLNKKMFFSQFNVAQIFCQQITENEAKFSCTWLTWILMPDHFHGLLRLSNQSTLSQVVGSIKGRSALLINQQLNRKGSLWQTAFYDRALRIEDDRRAIARYIVANPLRKGLVKSIGDYPYWNSIFINESTF
jgi:putative transposase